MTNLEQTIIVILKTHIGFYDAISQYVMTQQINEMGMGVSCRQVRRTIEGLIKQGYPIISTPRGKGGYCWIGESEEGLDCARRIRRQAIKLFIKARKIRENSRVGQMRLV